MEYLKDLHWNPKGECALYRRGGEYIAVSTVNLTENRRVQTPLDRTIVDLAGALGGYATAGEETMAFKTDETGENIDWTELAVATGENSRQAVLDELETA